jgi:hypothetical protein
VNTELTVHTCGPTLKCPDGSEHDMTGWEEFEDYDGCFVGTAVCTKCKHRACDDAYWMD